MYIIYNAKCLLILFFRLPVIFLFRVFRFWLRFDLIFNFLYRKELKKMDEILHGFTEAPLKVKQIFNYNV